MEISTTHGTKDTQLFIDSNPTVSRQTIKMTMLEYSQFSHKLSITRKTRHKSHPVWCPIDVFSGGKYIHLNPEHASLINGAQPIKTVIEITGSGLDSKKPNSKKPKFKNKTLDTLTCTIKDIEKAITPTSTRTIVRDKHNRKKSWVVEHLPSPDYHYVVHQIIDSRNVITNDNSRTKTKKQRYRKADLLKMFEIN